MENQINPSSDDILISERKDKVIAFLKTRASWITYIALAIIIWINVKIRSSNMYGLKDITTGTWTLGPDLDPFLFLRTAKEIVIKGSIPVIDYFRYVPLGFKNAGETQLLPYMIAYLYKFLHIFSSNVIVEYAAVIFPVVMSVFTAIFFFLFVKKVFEEKGKKISGIIALVATAFLITLPSLLPRTIAGIPEKESAGFAFMFAVFYFFIMAWKAKSLRNATIFGSLAGVSTALMGLVWGMWIMIFLVIGASVFIAFLLGKVDKKEIIVYSAWMVFTLLFTLPFTERFNLVGLITSSSGGVAFGVWFLLIINFVLFKTKINEIKIIQTLKQRSKLPNEILSLIFSFLLILLFSSIFFGVSFLPGIAKDMTSHLTTPYVDRFSFTVAENRQPYFTEWGGSFGPTQINLFGNAINIPPLFFWLFFIGSILLFYETVKLIGKKERMYLVIGYVLFLFGLIFSRYSTTSVLDGESFISSLIYFSSIIVFIGAFAYVYWLHEKEKKKEVLKGIDFNYIFMFILFFLVILAARSAVRLTMVLAPIAAISITYLVVDRIEKAEGGEGGSASNKIWIWAIALIVEFIIVFNIDALSTPSFLKTILVLFTAPAIIFIGYYFIEKKKNKKEDNTKKIISYVVAGIILVALFYTLYYNYEVTSQSAKSYVPYQYTFQWQKAMSWVRNNTPENAVFSHWWDYGYWVQSIGNRATVLDGGNAIVYWDYLMGRHVLTGKDETEAMEFMYTHNSSYLLIDSTEIGKYSAYSSIGSDENYDRYSWIGTFVMNEQNTQETMNKTMYVYQAYPGPISNDQDIIWKDGDNEVIIPFGKGAIVGIILPINKDENSSFEQPVSVFVYQGKQIRIPMRYLYVNNKKYDFGSGLNTGLLIMPRVLQQGQGVGLNNIGAALYLSEKNLNALWVRLYLLGEGQNFRLVHNEPNSIIQDLRNQGMTIGDFAFFGDILGPIKIWNVKFPSSIKANPEYLKTDYPNKELTIAKQVF